VRESYPTGYGLEKTGGMDRALPEEMPARWVEQIRALVQDLIHRSADETRRHFDVVADSIRSDVRVVAEGHVGLVERLDRFQQEVRRDLRRVERRLLRLEARR
jgi:hypothetical protein